MGNDQETFSKLSKKNLLISYELLGLNYTSIQPYHHHNSITVQSVKQGSSRSVCNTTKWDGLGNNSSAFF